MDNRTSKPFAPNKASLLAILMASMVIIMGAAAVAPALKPIAEHFDIDSEFIISLVVSLPSLSVAITGFGVGLLADRIGKSKVFLLSLTIFTLAGAGAFLLDDYLLILVARFILGVGITGISITTTALISEYYMGVQRAKVIGLQAAAIGIGALVLESIGGALADVDWNYPFLVYLIGVPIILIGLFSIRDMPKQVAASGEQETPTVDDHDSRGTIALCYAMIFMGMFLMFTLPMNFSYFISEMGGNYSLVGVMLGILGVSQAVMSILYSRRTTKFEDHDAFIISFLMIGLGLCLLFFGNIIVAVVSMILVGFSLGLLTPTIISRLSMLSTIKTSGKIMGGYSVFMNLASFVSTVVFAPLLSVIGSYCNTYLVMGIVGFAVAAIVLIIKARSRPSASDAKVADAKVHEIVDGTPSMYRKVLVATDGSMNSDFAVKAAVNIARKNNAELSVLFVMDPNAVSNAAGTVSVEILNQTAEEASRRSFDLARDMCSEAGVKVETVILNGYPADVIAEESKEYDLCICGSLGKTNAKRAVIGSVAEKVVRTAHCPVLVCRTENEN